MRRRCEETPRYIRVRHASEKAKSGGLQTWDDMAFIEQIIGNEARKTGSRVDVEKVYVTTIMETWRLSKGLEMGRTQLHSCCPWPIGIVCVSRISIGLVLVLSASAALASDWCW